MTDAEHMAGYAPPHDPKEAIKKHLDLIVGNFNEGIQHWQERHGARADFRWGYADEGKTLEIRKIEIPIYDEKGDSPASTEIKRFGTMEELLTKAEQHTHEKDASTGEPPSA